MALPLFSLVTLVSQLTSLISQFPVHELNKIRVSPQVVLGNSKLANICKDWCVVNVKH